MALIASPIKAEKWLVAQKTMRRATYERQEREAHILAPPQPHNFRWALALAGAFVQGHHHPMAVEGAANKIRNRGLTQTSEGGSRLGVVFLAV